MGTRSTIKFVSSFTTNEGKTIETPIINIYQQYDGYISGKGHDLARWLLSKSLCNGFGSDTKANAANGVGCLAAQFVKENKRGIGNMYIVPMSDKESYNYKVIIKDYMEGDLEDLTTIKVTNYNSRKPIFVGSPSELLNFEEKYDE